MLLQQSPSSPSIDCSNRDAMAHVHLLGGEQPSRAQSAMAALQIEGLADMCNLLQVERPFLPGPFSRRFRSDEQDMLSTGPLPGAIVWTCLPEASSAIPIVSCGRGPIMKATSRGPHAATGSAVSSVVFTKGAGSFPF